MQKSALITGLSLALSGAMLAGIGEWAASGVDSSTAYPASAGTPAASTSGDVTAAALPAPAIPETPYYVPASTPSYTFRRNVPEVRLQFTVADEQGRLLPNLSASDIRVLDDQTPVAHFTDFERDDNLPLRLGLLLDTSDSVKRVLPDEKAAALEFLNRILRPQSDNAFVIGFAGTIRVWQTPTADRSQLIGAINRLQQPGWGTRFFDALYSACADQLAAHGDKPLVHRALVVLSDGDDTDSLRNLADVVALAQRSEIQIHALTLRGKKSPSVDRGDQVLIRLTEATGGRLYVAKSSSDLDRAFSQIEQDLRTQYYVSFTPQSMPGFHSLRVEVRNPQNAEVHARQGYFAQ
ncbi:MAG: VWA domain-containing protein [Candidatus Korobacteraceae bacterium]